MAEENKISLKRGGIVWTIWQILEAALFIGLGVLAIVFSGNTDFHTVLFYIVGVVLILGGALKIVTNFIPLLTASTRDGLSYSLVVGGSLELALGITIICDLAQKEGGQIADFIRLIILFLGIACLVGGVIFMVYSAAMLGNKKMKDKLMPIVFIVVGAILAALGIVMLIYRDNNEAFTKIILIIAGILMILAGIAILVFAFVIKAGGKKAKDEMKSEEKEEPEVIDATEIEQKEKPKALENKKK